MKHNSIELKTCLPHFAFLSAEITSDHNDLLPLQIITAIVLIIFDLAINMDFKGICANRHADLPILIRSKH